MNSVDSHTLSIVDHNLKAIDESLSAIVAVFDEIQATSKHLAEHRTHRLNDGRDT